MEISVYRHAEGVKLATIAGGYRVSRLYIGYTLKEAKRLFRAYVREEAGK